MSDDLRYRVDSARELVMIHDELLVVRGFNVNVNVSCISLVALILFFIFVICVCIYV